MLCNKCFWTKCHCAQAHPTYQQFTKIGTTPSQELDSLFNDMAQYIPTTTEYTFTFLNGDTYSLTFTYAPNQVGTPAFLHECKQKLSRLTGHPVATLVIQKHEDNSRLYFVTLCEVPPMVALGDICCIRKGMCLYERDMKAGDTPVYGCKLSPLPFTTNKPNRTGKSLVIPYTGVTPDNSVRIFDFPFFLNEFAFTLHTKNEDILLQEYLNYVMLAMKDDIFNLVVPKNIATTTLRMLNIHKFKELKLPIPSLQTQFQLVQEVQTIDADIQVIEERIKCEERRIEDLRQLKTDVVALFCGVDEL